MPFYVYKPVVSALAQVADNYEIDKVRIRLQWVIPGPLRCNRYWHSVVMITSEKGDFSFLNVAVCGAFCGDLIIPAENVGFLSFTNE